MPILDHFGLVAPWYDRVIRLQSTDTFVRIARLPIQGIMLDAGGGTGRVAAALRGLSGSIVVADASLQMLQQAHKKGGLLTVCSLTEKLPFPDETIERIIMVDALHHVVDQAGTAKELWRVLKPGGRLVIEEPDIQKFTVKLVALAEKLALMRSHFLTPQAIVRLFSSHENASSSVEQDGFNAWVVIEKLPAVT